MAFENPSNEQRKEILEQAQVVAVVGCSNKPDRTSYMIAEALQHAGYTIIPVNPIIAGETVLGEKVVASLKDIETPVDIVDVFRRSEETFPIALDTINMKHTPKAFWLQQGVYNEEAADLVKNNGIEAIMDKCIKVDHAILVGRK
ncbi:CoA-binding protein [Brevibacillus daliensis]|uniref:CoA-binding protein n=1 Tax=Brevibacillus daliensis TaxID=2892995 RepID=UPI001E37C225|nr:CoA-binding protein [Brevibacillus daliensis]